MKKNYLLIAIILIEALLIVGFYFFAKTQRIEAEKIWYEAARIKQELKTTQQELDETKEELKDCRE